MNIINATPQERNLIKEILHDYPQKDFKVRVVEKKRNYGHFSQTKREIVLKRFDNLMDFYHILAHEVCHYVQYLNEQRFSEREADEFAVMMVNKRYGTNWTAQRKKKLDGGYYKYLEVNKGENVGDLK